MLRLLLAKDLRRVRRNPLPWLINLIVPLALTALIGLVFGRPSDNGALGRIRFAVVDEDKTVLGNFLSGAASQSNAAKYLEPVFMERDEALREINDDKLSAVLILPANFTSNYLTASQPVSLELAKNPAESIHPAVLEELFGAAVTGLNAVSRNFNSDFPQWKAVAEGKTDFHEVSVLIERAGNRFKMAKSYIDPPLVSYQKEPWAAASTNTAAAVAPLKNSPAKAAAPKAGSDGGIFAFLLIGMSAMFLLFIAGNAMTDLIRELKMRTFERYQTLRESLAPFVAGKILFTVVMLVLCGGVMLGGGGLIFHIHWERPFALMTLGLAYACCIAALFALLVALVPDERPAAVLYNIAGIVLGMAGGCAFPARQLPAFLRDHITPLLPSNWFVRAARNLQEAAGDAAWAGAALKLAVLGLALAVVAGFLFRRRFQSGLRA